MRITIDLTPLLVRSAGVKTYLHHWFQALRESAHSVESFPVELSDGPLRHDASMAGLAATVAGLARGQAVNRLPEFAALAFLPSTDLFHASSLTRRFPRRALRTTTLHDLSTALSPEFHPAANIESDRRFFSRVIPQCDGIVCVSEATRQDAIRVLGIPERRVAAIHSGVSRAYFDAKPDELVTRRYGLIKPYFLYTGTIEPRKNVDALLDAYRALPADVRESWDLAVAGSPGWKCDSTMARLRDPVTGVRYLSYVPESDLPALFATASAFVYPSLFEGFGLPIAQAMACGAPVLTSNTAALVEIAGGAAQLVDPRSPESLRTGLFDLATSPASRTALSQIGRKRAERFRWARCARESLSYFESLADRS